MLTNRERWIAEKAYNAGVADGMIWNMLHHPESCEPSLRGWLAEPEAECGLTVEHWLATEAPE